MSKHEINVKLPTGAVEDRGTVRVGGYGPTLKAATNLISKYELAIDQVVIEVTRNLSIAPNLA